VAKTALIVDDSKSARVVLKRMLEAHELNVDTVESAENALDYLSDHRPDVIFMDHLMPGMDGFEAVTAIKNNPDTATIPIMMYTSQEGELYVGQARALGAVGVLPKTIEPVEVSKVLTTLRMIGADSTAQQGGEQDSAMIGTSGEFPGLETLDHDLRILITDLFEQQRSIMRRDILGSYEAIAARVVDQLRPVTDRRDVDIEADEDSVPSLLLPTVVFVLIVVTTAFAWLYWQREREWTEFQLQHTLLQQEVEDQRVSGNEDSRLAQQQLNGYRQSVNAMFTATLAGLEWGANQGSLYGFDELPLGDDRLAVLEQLAEQLENIEFRGIVRIDTHVGDFCLSATTGPNGYEMAQENMAAVNCDRTGSTAGEAYELGLRQSVAFANYVRLADERSAGKIRYEITSHGNFDPVLDYPIAPENVSAGTWNDIAAKNNRVAISIIPDSF